MKRHRHTPEQAARKLREGDRLLAGGTDLTRGARSARDRRVGLEPVAEHLWGNEGRRCQASEGAGGRERPPQEASGRSRAGQGGVEGVGRGKMVTPDRRRRAVVVLRERFGVSERRACRVVGQHRSTQRRPARPAPAGDEKLRRRLRRFAWRPPRLDGARPTTFSAVRDERSSTRRSVVCGEKRA